MPNAPKTPNHAVRWEERSWSALGELAAAAGLDRAALLRQLAAWWMREPGAKHPARPSHELAAAVRQREQPADPDLEGRVAAALVNGTAGATNAATHVSAGQKSSSRRPQQSPAL